MKKWRGVELVEPRDESTYTVLHLCDCGRPATKLCSDVDPAGITLVRCQKHICGEGPNGSWCSHHRHEEGTMGYPAQMRVSFDYEGEDAEGEGLLDHLVAFWRNTFWSSERKANWAWRLVKREHFPPPRPIPKNVKIRVKGFIFELRDGRLVKVEGDSISRGGPFG